MVTCHNANTNMRERNDPQEENMRLRNFSSCLKILMRKYGLTQIELAAQAGISQTSLSRYLAGKQEPRFGEVVKLARALGTGIAEFDDGRVWVTEDSIEAPDWRNRALSAERKLESLKLDLIALAKKISTNL